MMTSQCLQNTVSSVRAIQKTHETRCNITVAAPFAGRVRALSTGLRRDSSLFSQQLSSRQLSITARASPLGDAYVGSLIGTGLKFGIVVGRFNDLVTKLLLEGALEHFERHGVPSSDVDVAWVPGSFELPVVAKAMAKSGKYDAVIAIGVVVRGATAHYDAVVGGATSGVLNASTDSGIPVIFGVLTCDTMEQAMDRAGGKVGNKGGEAAVTAIETANLLKQLRQEGKAAKPW